MRHVGQQEGDPLPAAHAKSRKRTRKPLYVVVNGAERKRCRAKRNGHVFRALTGAVTNQSGEVETHELPSVRTPPTAKSIATPASQESRKPSHVAATIRQ